MSKRLGVDPLKYARCAGCPLAGRPVVPGQGYKKAPDFAFVAEAPGETEEEQGVPLIGKSGQFLRTVLADLKINEDRCYFTNICLCRPTNNATPTTAMANACLGRLAAELVYVKPKVIVTLGNIASKFLARHRGTITRVHGMYKEIELFSKATNEKYSVGVVPTYHPAGVLRGPELFRDFLEELQFAQTIVDGQPGIIQPPYENYTHILTQEGFEWLVEELPKHPMVAVDIETDKMDWFDARILCIGFSWERGTAYVLDWCLVEQNYKNTKALNEAIKGVRLAFQNGVYDMPFLLHNGLTNAFYYLDTMQAHYLLDERQNTHGLERLAIKYYRAPAYKSEFRESIGVRSFVSEEVFSEKVLTSPKEDLFNYNGADTDYTYRLARDLTALVKKDGQLPVLRDIEMRSCRLFTEFTRSGLLVDRDYLDKMGEAWVEEEDELVRQMRAWVADPVAFSKPEEADGLEVRLVQFPKPSPKEPEFNPNSTKQLAWFLYDILGLTPFGGADSLGKDKIDEGVISSFIATVDDPEAREYWTSRRTVMSSGMKGFGGEVKGIKPRTTSTYMLYWLRQQSEFPNLIIRWRRIRKRRSLYYHGLQKYIFKDGRVRPKYNLTATRTGRKATENPAIHNLPRGDEIYNIFIPDPGWCLLHADYSQAELRMMCHYSGDKALLHILNTSDPHSVFAKRMFHLSDEDWEKLSKAEISDKRIASKMITFGLPYGRSAAGLAPQLGITKEEAEQYIRDFFAPIPDLEKWLIYQRARGVKDQVITSIFGRRRRFPLITDKYHKKEVERMAGNMAIQSAINDLTLLAYVNTYDHLCEAGIPVKPGAHIHDSINFSVPIPFWRAAVEVAVEALAYKPFETEVDFPAEVEIGDRWGHMITVHKGGEWVTVDPDGDAPEWLKRTSKC